MFSNTWVHKSLYKHCRNITSTLLFTIVFGIHCIFFTALPIGLIIYRSVFLFYKTKLAHWKIGCISFCSPNRHWARDLSRSVDPFWPSVVFYIETSHLNYSANQMTGFYMKYNTALKYINSFGTSGPLSMLSSIL